jgi:hypothetical protein
MNVNLSSITTPLRALWDDLVESRLWPVAIVLVVALIAVPVVLLDPAKSTPPPPPSSAATGPGSPGIAFQPAVSTEGRKSSEIRKDLRSFKRKNPFTPQGLTTGGAGTAEVAGEATPTNPTAGSTGSESFTGGGSSSSGGDSGAAPTPVTPGTTTETFFYHYTVDVRFGEEGKEENKTLSDFRSLPSSKNPVLVFMGVKNDGETAVFLISANATTVGDGKCSPSDTECTFLYMKKGNQQTIEAIDQGGAITVYTLELRDIDVKRTTAPEKASSSSSSDPAASRSDRPHRLRRIENTFRALGL